MSLSGVNRKCRKCSKKCKQWEQVTVVHCPNYAFSETGGVSKASKTRRKTQVERSLETDTGVATMGWDGIQAHKDE